MPRFLATAALASLLLSGSRGLQKTDASTWDDAHSGFQLAANADASMWDDASLIEVGAVVHVAMSGQRAAIVSSLEMPMAEGAAQDPDDEPVPAPPPAAPALTTLNETEMTNTTTTRAPVPENTTTPCPCATTDPPPPPYTNASNLTTAPPTMEPLAEQTAEEEEAMNATRAEAELDCVMSDWGEWSSCQSVQGLRRPQRFRDRTVVQPARAHGSPCGHLSDQAACV